MSYNEICVNREELYQKVWSQPVSQVAKEYGISDVGLAKICRRLKVPLPGLGYWQQKRAGMKVKTPPLRPLPSGQQESSYAFRLEKLPIDEQQHAEAERMMEFEELPESRICVPAVSDTFHPLVAKAEKSLRKARRDINGLLKPRTKKCLSLDVGPDSLDRALRIMDTLIKALEARNIKVTIEHVPERTTSVSLLGEVLKISLEEILFLSERHPETERERKRKEMLPGLDRPVYVFGPSGKLALKIKESFGGGTRKTWADGKKQKVEDCLNKFVLGLVKAALAKRSHRIEDEKRRLEWQEWERRRAEERQRRLEEEAKVQSLMKDVDAWHKSQKIRVYLGAVRDEADKRGDDLGPERDLGRWLAWATQYADRIDPLAREELTGRCQQAETRSHGILDWL